jgi:hypothetical protein
LLDSLALQKPAETVADEIRFVTVDGQRREVAKIVARTQDDTRTIEQYAADGTLLLRTLQRKFAMPKPDGAP